MAFGVNTSQYKNRIKTKRKGSRDRILVEMNKCILDSKAQMGEGLCWDRRSKRLYWVDIERHELHIYDPHTGDDSSYPTGEYIGTVAPRASGGLIAGLKDTIAAFNPETGSFSTLAELPASPHDRRINDGKCGPDGRFWFGTVGLDFAEGHGGFYVMDTDLKIRQALPFCSIPNGFCWSLDDKTLYFIDTLTKRVDAFDFFLKDGRINNRRTIADFSDLDGLPDGMNIDTEGKLWIALFGGGCVVRYDPATGAILEKIELPTAYITNCAFGGDTLDKLYMTSSRIMVSGECLIKEPLAGGIFVDSPGVSGVAPFEFRG